MKIETAILAANKFSFFLINGKVYQITAIMGQAFICYQYDRESKQLQGDECVISARMVMGITALSPFID